MSTLAPPKNLTRNVLIGMGLGVLIASVFFYTHHIYEVIGPGGLSIQAGWTSQSIFFAHAVSFASWNTFRVSTTIAHLASTLRVLTTGVLSGYVTPIFVKPLG